MLRVSKTFFKFLENTQRVSQLLPTYQHLMFFALNVNKPLRLFGNVNYGYSQGNNSSKNNNIDGGSSKNEEAKTDQQNINQPITSTSTSTIEPKNLKKEGQAPVNDSFDDEIKRKNMLILDQQLRSKKLKNKNLTLANYGILVGILVAIGGLGNWIYENYQKPEIVRKQKEEQQKKLKLEKEQEQRNLQLQEKKKKLKIVESFLVKNYEDEIGNGQFLQDQVYQSVKKFIQAPFVKQNVKVIYGQVGIGKSTSLKYYAQSKRGKQPVMYVTLRRDGQLIYGLDKMISLQEDDPIRCLFESFQHNKEQIMSILKDNEEQTIMKGKEYRMTLIVDEFNVFKNIFGNTDFQNVKKVDSFMRDVIFGLNDADKVKVILVSSDQDFVYSFINQTPSVREDKFRLLKTKISQADLKRFLEKVHKFDPIQTELVINYYSNKRDMQESVKQYKAFKNSNLKQNPHKYLKNLLQMRQVQTLQKMNHIIKKLAKSKGKRVRQVLLATCEKKELQKAGSQQVETIYEILREKKIFFGNQFQTRLKEKAYCQQYAGIQQKRQEFENDG